LDLAQDFIRKKIGEKKSIEMALHCINKRLMYHGSRNTAFNLPVSKATDEEMQPYYDGARLSPLASKELAEKQLKTFSAEQKKIFDAILFAHSQMDDRLRNDKDTLDHLFFIYGFGGSGKTYMLNTLIHYCIGQDISIKPVSWTGIAASLMVNGATAHSAFRLPISFNAESVCNIKAGSVEANVLRAVKIIIWDEITVSRGNAINCVNNLLQDLMGNTLPFGGKVVVVSGDFRQCLPIIKSDRENDIINSSVVSFKFWPKFVLCELKINQRLDPGQVDFAKWQERVGNGEVDDYKDDLNAKGYQDRTVAYNPLCKGRKVRIAQEHLIDSNHCLEDEIYGESFTIADQDRIAASCILTPLNKDVREMNVKVLQKLQSATEKTYFSSNSTALIDTTDEIDELDDIMKFPIDVIQTWNPSGVALHELTLKVGCMCLVMKNLSTQEGLVNGTRVVVKDLQDSFVEVEILFGPHAGKEFFIPRVKMSAPMTKYAVTLNRRQFPLQLAYCMTINKSQGQTFESVGLLLTQPVFSHGQFYVSVTRSKRKDKLKIWVKNGSRQGVLPPTGRTYVENIVYAKVFERLLILKKLK
jgi:hypothetical protein